MAEQRQGKGKGKGLAARITDPFSSNPPSFQQEASSSASGAFTQGAFTRDTTPSYQSTRTTLSRGVQPSDPLEEDTGESELREGGPFTSSLDPLGGLRTSLDNLNVAEASAQPGTPAAVTASRVLEGEDEAEPHTPPEHILREGRSIEVPGAPRKSRRSSGFDKKAMARVTKKLDFD